MPSYEDAENEEMLRGIPATTWILIILHFAAVIAVRAGTQRANDGFRFEFFLFNDRGFDQDEDALSFGYFFCTCK